MTYFIHDVTLDPGARGHGHAAAIVPILIDVARGCGLRRALLVAVNRAGSFWAKIGFAEKLSTSNFRRWQGQSMGRRR
jgi:N-acetylglutamate synthase-like GNAT family acetyltransferase